MSEESPRIERDRQMILDASAKGPVAKLWAYTRLSGPGWLQSAITLGGGSLAGSLYLGTFAGYGALWWQPLAMIMGVIMLSAIGYVALSTGQRPFDAINRHVNPVLGWGWAVATLMANLVWCMPQYSLGTAAVSQNLFPEIFGNEGPLAGETGEWLIVAGLFVVTGLIIWFYDTGGWGVRLFEWLLKLMVAVIVVSFFAVVVKMSTSADGLNWGRILRGLVPDFSVLTRPSGEYADVLSKAGLFKDYWSSYIISQQQQIMITAAATAVGINMTFLLPYSMLRRGWDKDFRGLAIFDLSTGLFVPYVIATGCVVIAAASQFHATEAPGLVTSLKEGETAPNDNIKGQFNTLLDKRIQYGFGRQQFEALDKSKQLELIEKHGTKDQAVFATGKAEFDLLKDAQTVHDAARTHSATAIRIREESQKYETDAVIALAGLAEGVKGPGPLEEVRAALPLTDRRLAAMVVRRDAFDLAASLKRLARDSAVTRYIFGIGVIGMAISTIIILMLINGFVLTEISGNTESRSLHRVGCFMASVVGAIGFKLLWSSSQARVWLAVPTSMFGMVLLPIAYITFLLMMNSKSLMGANMPPPGKRLRWNILMGVSAAFATVCCLWSISISDTRMVGFYALGGFAALALLVQLWRMAFGKKAAPTEEEEQPTGV